MTARARLIRIAVALLPGLAFAATSLPAAAQTAPAHVRLTVTSDGQPVAGAEVRGGGGVLLSDSTGVVQLTLSPGLRRLLVWKPGYSVDTVALSLRSGRDTTAVAVLNVVAQEEEPIIVHAARAEVRVEDEPTRVEVLAPEDVEEKSLTRPGDITNLLVEMGGVHVQPVAPGLGGATIRLQGLPGRYTLLLTDGLPLYGAHAPAFSLVQAPPLDLRQVEVIKGAATTLYGPAALAGVVDLISRAPADARQVLLSRTSLGGTDGLLWLSRRPPGAWGYTFLGGAHAQERRDVNGDGWADVPGYQRAEARPRLFWSGSRGSSLLLTAGGIAENRRGGTLAGGTVPGGSAFEDRLDTRHGDAGAVGHFVLSPTRMLGFRAAVSATRHGRVLGGVAESDDRRSALAEATLSLAARRGTATLGASAEYDGLRTSPRAEIGHDYGTGSLFGEGTWTPADAVALEGGARLDRHSLYGAHGTYRLSGLYRIGSEWSLRVSGGTAFFAPDPLMPEVEEVGLTHLQTPLDLSAERGASGSVDLAGSIGPVQVSATVFTARVSHPVLAGRVPGSPDSTLLRLANAGGPIRASGAELFAVYAREPILVTATFSRQYATELSPEDGRREDIPLTPRSAGGIDLAWEEDEAGARVALEVFFTGRQRVEDDPYRSFTPTFATVELLAAKKLGRLELFVNAENLTNVRQTHWDPLLRLSPGLGGRWTTDEWAPLEGRLVNAGLRIAF